MHSAQQKQSKKTWSSSAVDGRPAWQLGHPIDFGATGRTSGLSAAL
jgi:hypothetical protein